VVDGCSTGAYDYEVLSIGPGVIAVEGCYEFYCSRDELSVGLGLEVTDSDCYEFYCSTDELSVGLELEVSDSDCYEFYCSTDELSVGSGLEVTD
jgi:hypothetical protein